jgi:hypothetical protein
MSISRPGVKGHLTLLGWLSRAFGAFSGVMPVLELVEEIMIKQAEKTLKYLLGLAVIYLSMLAGIIIMVIGAALLVMDFTVIPRGMALMIGGLFLVLVSAFLMQIGKK